MARPLRIEYPGAWYHVIQRGLRRQRIFIDDEDRIALLDLLGVCLERFSLETHTYVLMNNHYHLFVRTLDANLGRAMRHLDGVYTQAFNRRHGLNGPLFQGRYKGLLVQTERYGLALTRYISRNPIEAHIVNRPEDFVWSSYPAYARRSIGEPWLQESFMLNLAGGAAAYRKLVTGAHHHDDAFLAKTFSARRMPSVLGDLSFRQIALSRAAESDETAASRRLSMPRPSLDTIDRAVAQISGAGAKALARMTLEVRARLARDLGGASLAEIAEHCRIAGPAQVSSAIRRLDRKLEKDGELACGYDEVVRAIREQAA
jgi:putative transposase